MVRPVLVLCSTYSTQEDIMRLHYLAEQIIRDIMFALNCSRTHALGLCPRTFYTKRGRPKRYKGDK